MLRYIFVEFWTYDPNQTKALELPKEHEMSPRDKYTVFSPHARGYRKGVHKVPKFTRVRSKCLSVFFSMVLLTTVQLTLRTNPKGF